jgi:hypothetical protein
VYDTRNDDTHIGRTGTIEMVNVTSGEIKELYHTTNQTESGPGVGAATFSPVAGRVIFIHGIRNSGKNNPYGFTRRTGIAIDIDKPNQPIFMDARDITPPFTEGALRGGTHAHSWSGDGEWISFTYNDHVMEQLAKTDTSVKDLRTVGVMAPFKRVMVNDTGSVENNNGEMFATVVVKVTENPQKGSDEIDRAFDEGWIGIKGYQKKNGEWQKRAIAFQGNLRDENGKTKTEVFVVDLPADLTTSKRDEPLEGTTHSRPNVPEGVVQRRVSFTNDGIKGPRHSLRATPDGSLIGFLSEDKNHLIQIFAVSPNGGEIKQVTYNSFPVESAFNFSPEGKDVAYMADNSIFVTDLETGKSIRMTNRFPDDERPVGSPVWSNDGKLLAYNRYIKNKDGRFLQIFYIPKLQPSR